ncbi:phosphoglycerate dehydrogenase [Gordonia sp. UBA6683]|uniref:phosphoglycerate dehydrogenase n=1 Tax=Gordonia sp. UBA6683 TaxID=1946577 RepID=UPI0025C20DC8|nr:phosphoglycerate dehydrogenase [Gordonia sp. UBA6683]
MTRETLVVTCRQMQVEIDAHIERLKANGINVLCPDLTDKQQFTATELKEYLPMTAMIAGDDELSRDFLAAAHPDLRVLIRWGIGMDSVDHDAAREFGIIVKNTPGVFAHEVAESAFGYIIDLARGQSFVDRSVRNGRWIKYEGTTLAGSKIGIIGLGAIGKHIAKLAHGFGMHVYGYDPFVSQSAQVELLDLEKLAQTAQFVVVACPLTSDTHHLIDASFLNRMREDAYIINVARGPVVDESALCTALQSAEIAGAGLDVFEQEPLPSDSPLRRFENVVLGAHNGSNTRAGVARASAEAVNILLTELGIE